MALTQKEADQLLTALDTMSGYSFHDGMYVPLANVKAMIILFTEGGYRDGNVTKLGPVEGKDG